MSGVEIAMVAMAAVGTATAVAGAQNQAKFAKAAAERDRIAAEEATRAAKLKAAQDEVARREAGRKLRATQLAQAAALGFDPTQSRSFLAIQRDSDRQEARDIENIRLNALIFERRSLLGADASDVRAQAASSAATYKTVGAIASFAGSTLKAGKKGGWFDDKASPMNDIGDAAWDEPGSDAKDWYSG